jgi:hypothetical protein
MEKFPSALEQGKLALHLLEESEATRQAEDLQCALIIGFTFGFASKHNEILCRLADADWHVSHEDVVSALQEIGIEHSETVKALYRVTQIVPDYLAFDESRALAVKTIWALGRIHTPEAEKALTCLERSNDRILSGEARLQIRRRRHTK